jgi:Helix-hairpin-helix domain/Fingers domain of DNA polymerase lambda
LRLTLLQQARFKIWEKELSRWSHPANIDHVRISNAFDRKLTTHALLPEKCSEQLFQSWSNLAQTPIYDIEEGSDQKNKSKAAIQRSPTSLILVKSEWIVECLKAKAFLVARPYLHQLQCPVMPNISDSTVSLKNREDVTSLYGPSYKSGSKARSDAETARHQADNNKRSAGGTDSSGWHGPGPASSSSNSSGNQIAVTGPGSSSSASTSSSSNSGNKNNSASNAPGVIYDVVIPTNKNSHITDILKQMTVFYDLLGDNFREMVYKRCCGVLETHPTKIENIDEIIRLPGVGKSLGDKINEILKTGSLEKLENFKNDPKLSALVALGKIWGVGPKGAQNLYNLGYRSVKDLREGGSEHLTFQQRIGKNS